MGIAIRLPGNTDQLNDPMTIIRVLKEILLDLEDQLNLKAQVYSNLDATIPSGMNRGDIVFNTNKGSISISVRAAGGMVALTAPMIGGVATTNCQFLGRYVSAAAPTTQFPNQNDWGFYTQTGTAHYLCLRTSTGGTLIKVAMA